MTHIIRPTGENHQEIGGEWIEKGQFGQRQKGAIQVWSSNSSNRKSLKKESKERKERLHRTIFTDSSIITANIRLEKLVFSCRRSKKGKKRREFSEMNTSITMYTGSPKRSRITRRMLRRSASKQLSTKLSFPHYRVSKRHRGLVDEY